MKTTILTIVLALTILIVPSCSDITTSPDQQMLTEYVQTNPDATNNEVSPIGERPNKDTVKKDTSDKKRDTVGRKKDTTEKKRDTTKKEVPSIFNDLLIRLKLTPAQRVLVEKLLAEHRACVENCVLPLREAEKEIQTRSRIAEEQIKKALANGEITRTQAREKLNALKQRVNFELKNIPIRKSTQECIKSCDSSFISQLEKILSPEQKKTLKLWLEQKSKRGQSDKKDTVVVKRG